MQKLPDLLRNAAALMRAHQDEYRWGRFNACNVGFLMRAVLGLDGVSLGELVAQSQRALVLENGVRGIRTWTRYAHYLLALDRSWLDEASLLIRDAMGARGVDEAIVLSVEGLGTEGAFLMAGLRTDQVSRTCVDTKGALVTETVPFYRDAANAERYLDALADLVEAGNDYAPLGC